MPWVKNMLFFLFQSVGNDDTIELSDAQLASKYADVIPADT